jgi:hypothetical protein
MEQEISRKGEHMSSIDILRQKRNKVEEDSKKEDMESIRYIDLTDDEVKSIDGEEDITLVVKGKLDKNQFEIESVEVPEIEENDGEEEDTDGSKDKKPPIIRTHTTLMPS